MKRPHLSHPAADDFISNSLALLRAVISQMPPTAAAVAVGAAAVAVAAVAAVAAAVAGKRPHPSSLGPQNQWEGRTLQAQP